MASYYGSGYGGFAPYVPVAERRRQAQQEVAALKKKGQTTSPVVLEGRNIATTFWGKAWCDNLEAYSDYANRLPRGRTYVRNGSVVDLQIEAGRVSAMVMGSQLYRVKIDIRSIEQALWQSLIKECSGQIDSLVELLQGKLSRGVMEVITRKGKGLFPSPHQIELSCSCPDWATMCKHVAAVLYGVGARLDHKPDLLFHLRKVDQLELITRAGAGLGMDKAPQGKAKGKVLAGEDLSDLFGIDMDTGEAPPPSRKKAAKPAKPAKKPVPQPKVRAKVTRQELLGSGLTPSTLQTWLRTGLLLPSDERGIYKTTAAARKKIGEIVR